MIKHSNSGLLILLTSFLFAATMYANKPTDQRRDELRDSILAQIHEPAMPAVQLSILKLGAKGDSLTDCKPAFDKAMRLAMKRGGLKLIIPPGTYLINGPIHLVSNVWIELQQGARLKFSDNPTHYLPVVLTSWEGTMLYNYSPFIYGYKVENVAITGEGTIDGNSAQVIQAWKKQQNADQQLSRDMNHRGAPLTERIFGDGHFLRPQLLQFLESKRILIQGVKITNSPFWCVHLLKSENIVVRGVRYDAKNINNDGIDPEYSRNILIENVEFDNGDDNVAIKSGRDHEGRLTAMPSENIVIRNCRFKGLHAVVLGSEMSAGVRNIVVENCRFGGYCKRGIYLKSNPDRGGFMHNIYVKNVTLDKVEDLFYITSYYHGEGNGFATDISGVYIDGLSCSEASNAAIVIQGFPDMKVKDIYIDNLSAGKARVGTSINNAENVVLGTVNIGGIVMEAPSTAK